MSTNCIIDCQYTPRERFSIQKMMGKHYRLVLVSQIQKGKTGDTVNQRENQEINIMKYHHPAGIIVNKIQKERVEIIKKEKIRDSV